MLIWCQMIKESKIQMILKRTNILTNYAACSYGNKLVCVNDKFSNPFKSYLGEDAVYNFIDSILEESKYCSDMIKKHFNQKLVITKKDEKILRTLLNIRSVIMFMLMVTLL